MKRLMIVLLLLSGLCHAKHNGDYGNFTDVPMAVMLHEDKQCIYEANGYKIYAYMNYGKLYVSYNSGIVVYVLKSASPDRQVWHEARRKSNELHFIRRGNRWIPQLYHNNKLIRAGSFTDIDCSPPFDI